MKTRILIPLLCLAAGAAFAEDKMTLKAEGGLDIPAKFRACHADSDCALVEDVCSRWNWHPINKANAAAAESLYKNATVDCDSGNYPKPLVGCVAGSCAVVPDAKGCIFHVAPPADVCRTPCGEKDANGVCLLPDEQP